MDTFKGDIAGKQFYFKPQKDGQSYVVEPYRQTGMKSFKLVQRDPQQVDNKQKREWQIPDTENVTDEIRGMEAQFSDSVQERRSNP
jgi:hypothetical protein